MKKILKLFSLLIVLFSMVSCGLFNNDPYGDSEDIKALKNEGRYIEISMTQLDEMLSNNETFIFLIKSKSCYNCFLYMDEIASVLNDLPNEKIYCIKNEEFKDGEKDKLIKYTSDVIGEEYFINHEIDSTKLYAPTTYQVVNGKIKNAKIGFLAAKYLKMFYTYNFFSLETYSDFEIVLNRNVEFTLYLSTQDLKTKFIDELNELHLANSLLNGYYLNKNMLSNEQENQLILMINNLEIDPIESLNDKVAITFKNKVVTNYYIIE